MLWTNNLSLCLSYHPFGCFRTQLQWFRHMTAPWQLSPLTPRPPNLPAPQRGWETPFLALDRVKTRTRYAISLCFLAICILLCPICVFNAAVPAAKPCKILCGNVSCFFPALFSRVMPPLFPFNTIPEIFKSSEWTVCSCLTGFALGCILHQQGSFYLQISFHHFPIPDTVTSKRSSSSWLG